MMSLKLSKKSTIKKILLISLTNIGDVILTFPVMDVLKEDFPSAKLSVIIGPKAESLLRGNPSFDKVYVFNKHQSLYKSFWWMLELRQEQFDLVIDLRNTVIPFFISPSYRTSLCSHKMNFDGHRTQKHLHRLKSVYDFDVDNNYERYFIFISEKDEKYVDDLIEAEKLDGVRYVVVAPGAADSSKRWGEEKFASVCDHLSTNYGIKIIFIGSDEDYQIAQGVAGLMQSKSLNVCGRTSLVQLAALMRHCFFALVNDSAPMHLASYLNIPVFALFGPTDPLHYGPWSQQSSFLRKNHSCPACRGSKGGARHSCMDTISSDEVCSAFKIDSMNGSLHFNHDT